MSKEENRRSHLNLATKPIKNRRIFHLIIQRKLWTPLLIFNRIGDAKLRNCKVLSLLRAFNCTNEDWLRRFYVCKPVISQLVSEDRYINLRAFNFNSSENRDAYENEREKRRNREN